MTCCSGSVCINALSHNFHCPSGVRIQTTHAATIKRKYTVWGVSSVPAEKLQFEVEDGATGRKRKTTVAQYFKDTYRLHLRYSAVFKLVNCDSRINKKNSHFI